MYSIFMRQIWYIDDNHTFIFMKSTRLLLKILQDIEIVGISLHDFIFVKLKIHKNLVSRKVEYVWYVTCAAV